MKPLIDYKHAHSLSVNHSVTGELWKSSTGQSNHSGNLDFFSNLQGNENWSEKSRVRIRI